MKQKNDYVLIEKQMKAMNTYLDVTPDEDRCQTVLSKLEEIAQDLKDQKDPTAASRFEARWFELREKIKDFSDQKIFEDSKKSIEKNLALVLDPESVEA